MKKTLLMILLALVAPAANAQVAEKYRGDWLLVNGGAILHVAENGAMSWNSSQLAGQTSDYTFVASDERWYRQDQLAGPLHIAEDGTFTWQVGSPEGGSLKGQFVGDTLMLESFRSGAPAELKRLEFRKVAEDAAKKNHHLHAGPGRHDRPFVRATVAGRIRAALHRPRGPEQPAPNQRGRRPVLPREGHPQDDARSARRPGQIPHAHPGR
jgi:hypothetical protein